MIYIDTNQTPQLLGNWTGEDQMRCSFGAGITYGACVILEYVFLLQIGPSLDAVVHQQPAEVLHFWRCAIAPDECRKGGIVKTADLRPCFQLAVPDGTGQCTGHWSQMISSSEAALPTAK